MSNYLLCISTTLLTISTYVPIMYLNLHVNNLILALSAKCQSTLCTDLNLPVNYRNLTLSIDVKLPLMYLNHPVNYLNLYLLCISTYMSTILS